MVKMKDPVKEATDHWAENYIWGNPNPRNFRQRWQRCLYLHRKKKRMHKNQMKALYETDKFHFDRYKFFERQVASLEKQGKQAWITLLGNGSRRRRFMEHLHIDNYGAYYIGFTTPIAIILVISLIFWIF